MKKLKLEKAPLQAIEIDLPEGGTTIVKIKNLTVKQARQVDHEIQEIQKNQISGKLGNVDALFQTMNLICEFDQAVMESLDLDHVVEINEMIRTIKEETRTAKKKK